MLNSSLNKWIFYARVKLFAYTTSYSLSLLLVTAFTVFQYSSELIVFYEQLVVN
jgi:hypothetical protein